MKRRACQEFLRWRRLPGRQSYTSADLGAVVATQASRPIRIRRQLSTLGLLLGLALVMSAAPVGAADPDAGSPSPEALLCGYTHSQPELPNFYITKYIHCNTPRMVAATYDDRVERKCHAPLVRTALGRMESVPDGQPGDLVGEYHSSVEEGPCTDWRDNDPLSRDTVVGKAVVKRRHGGAAPMRPLPKARWELWYKGKAGKESDAVIDRPVLSSWDPNTWAPKGVPLTGYINDAGEFDDKKGAAGIDFLYPQTRPLANGATWYGCETDDTPVAYLRGSACKDTSLYLKVFAINEDTSVQVYDDQPMLMATIPLGHHFERTEPTDHTYEATTPAAHAYGAAYNVRDLAGFHRLGHAEIELVEGGESEYHGNLHVVTLNDTVADLARAEHLLAEQVLDNLDGIELIDEDCHPHSPGSPAAPADPDGARAKTCAFREGFADFLAVAAENEPGLTNYTFVNLDGATFDIENFQNFHDHPVEGSVAAALWDLWDETPALAAIREYRSGFGDHQKVSIETILDVADTADAETFDELWTEWRSSQGEDHRYWQIAWMNDVVPHERYSANLDPEERFDTVNCDPVDSCVGGRYLKLTSPRGGTPFDCFSWRNVATGVQPERDYDLWAKVPDIDGLASDASFTGHDDAGYDWEWFKEIDLSLYRGEWVKLTSTDAVRTRTTDSELDQCAVSASGILAVEGMVAVPRHTVD